MKSFVGLRILAIVLAALGLAVAGMAGNTTTTLSSTPNPSTYSQEVTFTVTVSGIQTPSGTVTLKDGSTTLGTKDLANEGTTAVTFTISDLGAGTHTITAEYSGYSDYGYDPSTSDPVYQTVNKASTQVSVEADVNPSVTGQKVTFTATVTVKSPGSGTPTGTVIFYANNVAISSPVSLDSDGKATCEASFNAADTDADGYIYITVEYSGDDNFNSSDNKNSPYKQQVNKADTTVTVESSQNPSVTGQEVTFTATVEASSPGSGTPTGTVTFTIKDKGGTEVKTGSATLNSSGKAFFTAALDASGSPYTVTADYGGDDNYNESSGSYSQTVNKADTTMDLSSDNNPASEGDTITFTATVNVSSPGAGTPTGTVTFVIKDRNGTQVASSTENLSSGTASYATSSLDASGSPYTVTATYGGDSSFNSSTSELTQFIKTESNVTVTSSNNPSVTGQSVTFTATVTVSGNSFTPTGTVTFTIKDKNGIQIDSSTQSLNSSGIAFYTTDKLKASGSPYTVIAAYSGDDRTKPGTASLTQTVDKADASVTITNDTPDPSTIGQAFVVQGTVVAVPPGSGTPGGTVYVNDGFGNECMANVDPATGQWSCTLIPDPGATSAGDTFIIASYNGDDNFVGGSSDSEPHTYQGPGTRTEVMGSETPLSVNTPATYTVQVVDVTQTPTIPAGTVAISVSPAGAGTLSDTEVTLDAAGRCTFTYTPTNGDVTPHVITVTYNPSDSHESSTGTFVQEVVKRKVDMTMKLDPTTAYIYQPVTVTVHVEDDTTEGTATTPQGNVTFDDGGVGGTFDGNAAPYTTILDSDGNCTVTYIPPPGSQGTVTITASYAGSAVHQGKAVSEQLKVNLRPTTTLVQCVTSSGKAGVLLVDEQGTCTVTVKDVTGDGHETAPTGTLDISSSLNGNGGDVVIQVTNPLHPDTSDSSKATISYLCTGLDLDGDRDTVGAVYHPDDGIHASSAGGYVQAIQRRPTETSLTCDATSDGVSCTVEVKDADDNPGTPSPPEGKIVDLSDNSDLVDPLDVGGCGATCSSGSFSKDTDAMQANVTVEYQASDRTHLKSTASQNIDRSSYITPDSGHNGAYHITQLITDLNGSCLAADLAASALDELELDEDDVPDPIVGVAEGIGVSVVEGETIPISDILATLTGIARIALQVYAMTACTDLDGDGIPGLIETTFVGTSDTSFDSDDDGMDDLSEIYEAGGWYGGNPKACPDPTDADSDNDGLLDGDEDSNYSTDFCNPDTDGDSLTDGQEVNSWVRANDWDHADPNFADTDHDGLTDDIEFAPGQLLSSQPANHSIFSTYVNNPDTDGDGIIDGTEDSNRNGKWDYTSIGGTGNGAASIGDGETNPCMADTDGDGLTDGEEAELFGSGMVHVITPYGTDTNPALDTDSDDDGLSDYEEVNVTNTDPLNYDTDGDGIWDVNEFIAIGGEWPHRQFQQISDPLDPDTDDDGLPDNIEYSGTNLGTGHGLGGSNDTQCPYVNDDDSDDDGLQDGHEDANHDGTITNTIGDTGTQGSGETSFCMADTDGDGLSDGQEEGLFGQGAVTAHTPNGDVTTVPALDKDSDDDGLSDYEEVNITYTDPLNCDTDGDGLSDLNELIATGGTYPKRSFRQVSDPLDPDTDDDGLVDGVEYNGTGMGTGHGLGGAEDLACPFVNDADSDHDGLADGVEDANHDGTWGVEGSGVTIGSYDSQAAPASDGYYETNLCVADTDGDGLTDGEEVAQLGGGPVSGRPASWPDAQPSPGFETVTPEGRSTTLPVADYSGSGPLYTFNPQPGQSIEATVPALDVDSDNDGLSDYEELNTTGTDPLDQDSDNDTIMDSDELIATGGAWPNRTFDQESDPLDINTDDDYLPDPVEGSCGNPVYTGTGLSQLNGGLGGTRDETCPYVNNADSDDDGVKDGAVIPITKTGPNGFEYSYVFIEGFQDVPAADVQAPGTVRTVVTPATGEQDDDAICNVCDSDSDGDGLTDGEEVGLGTNPADWDTDDDGRSDWHEVTGGGPIPTDPFDPDTDDDGLLDSAEVFGSNPTNPTVADTDGDGLCDGGAGTPYMVSGHPTVTVNPICKSCSTPGNAPCAVMARPGSADGIGDHPNPMGLGEDENGNGAWDAGETDPNQYDTDGDSEGDGIEKLGFSTSRQDMIPATDLFGRPIKVVYPSVGCMDPLNPDTDGDGLTDGYEDRNHDGNFDFLPSEFDHADPLPGPPIPYPTETNPCDPDTDHDGLTDYQERYQPNPSSAYPFNPTNPLDHDTDNDWILDGDEVAYVCTPLTFDNLDDDGDGLIDEDPPDGVDNDGDGYTDEDGPNYRVISVPVLDPTNRDSDSDGFIDGLDPDPCNSPLIPLEQVPQYLPQDTDGDGFADEDERLAGTDPRDPNSHPQALTADLDLDGVKDDRLWLVSADMNCSAELVVIDIDSNGLVDARVQVIAKRDLAKGDFDGDGAADDARYTVVYALSGRRAVQPRLILQVYDYGCDLTVDKVEARKD